MTKHHAIQLNVAGSNARMHALLNAPTYENFNIFIIQDPWWGRIGSQKDINLNNHNIYGTVNSPMYQCIIPPGFTDSVGPGVAIYIRNKVNIHAQFSNICPIHRDVLAIDLTMEGSITTIINAYPHGKTHKDTIKFITNINIPKSKPVIITGDFNLHHTDWAIPGSHWEKRHPNAIEREFQAYAEYQDLTIMNDITLPTRYSPTNNESHSIIDLTLLNSRAIHAWQEFNWEVDEPDTDRSLGSDHMAITWSIGPHDQAKSDGVTEPSPGFTIDTECEDDWVSRYVQILKEALLPSDPETAEDADRIAGAILSAMSNASQEVFPKKTGNGPARLPWWTEECSKAVYNLKHNPDHCTRDQLRAALQGAIRRAKRNRGNKILREILTREVFSVLKWSQGKRCALMPPIKSPNGGITATNPFQKAENFAEQFFVKESSLNISLEPLGVRSLPERPFAPITTEEITSSLKLTSNSSAPGAFGSNYTLLKWAFYSNPNIFVLLFNLCLNIGYHPTSLRNMVISPIPKPRRTDMSHPKNYRPIALLETLSKLLEKVITKRLIHEAGSHNIIPHAQFGGRDITSCTDAGLCMMHNIKAQHARKKAVTLLTLDVSGYFNNVDHNRLIYTMRRLGYANQICNWLMSYLTHRTAQFRIDGTLCPHIQLPPVGIPQGSPLSPILSSLYFIPLLVTSADPQAHSFAYIDDFRILTYSKTHQENITILQDITKRINHVAKCLGLEFEIPKSELIHFIRPRDHNVSNPTLTLSESGTDTVIKPQDCIRWLGFWLDRKLTFKEHIHNMANKAKAAISGLRMLANTQKGLTTRHARILFKAAVIPILTYGVPLWFHGHRQKSKLELLRKVQNDGIRWLLGAFRTTPVPVMEHLASIPPFHITCHKLIDNIGAKLRTIPRCSKLAKRLPVAWDSADPTLPRSKDSPIAHIASTSHPDIENVIPYLVHPSATSTPYPDNFTVKTTQKKDVAIKEHNEFLRAEQSRVQPTLIGYSDGHASSINGCPKIGYGYTLHISNRQVACASSGIGPRASIFDAEMLGLAKCLTKAVQLASDRDINKICLYCDNQSTIMSIHSLQRHPAQCASIIFRHALDRFLHGHPKRDVTIAWIPGHKGILGNEIADKLAKGGANLPPQPIFNRTVTWSRTEATSRASRTWNKVWNTHVQNRLDLGYLIPRHPSLKLHPIFNEYYMPRNVACRLVQLISGHGFYGEYRTRFHPELNPQCLCGESVQSTAHAIAFCPRQEDKRHILVECSHDLDYKVLFGTYAGLKAVSRYIGATGIGRIGLLPGNSSD